MESVERMTQMSPDRVYYYGFDWLRALGIFAVVWIHGCDTNPLALQLSSLAGFAVPVFTLVSFFLLQKSILRSPESSYVATVTKRLRRLVPAYLVWSATYIVLRSLKHAIQDGRHFSLLDILLVFFTGGASYQMYFIVALIYWVLFFLPLAMLAARMENRRAAATGLSLLGAGLLAGSVVVRERIDLSGQGSFWLQQIIGLSGYVPLGMAAACLAKDRGSDNMARVGIGAGVVALGWLVCGSKWGYPLVPSLGFLFWGIVQRPESVPPVVHRISSLSYGVFMVHAFFVEGLQMVFRHFGFPLESFLLTLAVILFSFLCSLALCEMLSRKKPLQWLTS